jgi:hypothetical protein
MGSVLRVRVRVQHGSLGDGEYVGHGRLADVGEVGDPRQSGCAAERNGPTHIPILFISAIIL